MSIPRLLRFFWAGCLLALVVVALFAPRLAPFDPLHVDPLNQFTPPNSEHILGLDQIGRDVFSRVIWGARYSLSAAALSAILAVVVGLVVGGVSGVLGGWADRILMQSVDILLALPGLLLALVGVTLLGNGQWQIAIAVGISLAPVYARLVRAAILGVREELFVEAAYALGASRWRILWRHMLPNAGGQIAALAAVVYAWALLNGTALDFLGLAGSPSTPSWGRMINEGRAFLNLAPWIALAPSAMLAVSVISVTGVSDFWRGPQN